MAKVMAAAVYARISSDTVGMGLGVTRQLEDCRKLAAERGWRVVSEYVDNDVSAYSGKRRPEYERMLADLRAGVVTAVVVYNLDRLTRRPMELEQFLALCESKGVRDLATVTADIDMGNDDGLFMARVFAAFAAKESGRRSARMKRKHQQRAEQGLPGGGKHRPFGYEQDRITINKAEARIIRECADRIIAGESLRSVALWLEATGVKTVAGGPWSTMVLRTMLTNPRMIGLRAHNGQVIGTAVWKPILTAEKQAQVIARLQARKVTGRRAPRRYVLSGMLRCGKCGHRLYSQARQDTRRYVCASGPDHQGCGHLTVVAAPVEDFITEAVLFRLDTPELAAMLTGADTSPEAATLREELAEDEGQLEELAAMWAAKDITAKEWKTARDLVEGRARQRQRQIIAQSNAAALSDLIGTGSDLRASWALLNLDRQAAIIRAVVDHVVIGPGVPGARGVDPDRVQPVWLL